VARQTLSKAEAEAMNKVQAYIIMDGAGMEREAPECRAKQKEQAWIAFLTKKR